MKKIFLSLCALLLFVYSQAQNSYLKSGMVMLVTAAKDSYTKEVGYKDWVIKITGSTAVPTDEEEKVLKEVYYYISTETRADLIYKNYDGNSLLDLKKQFDKGDTSVLGTSNQRCGLWCWLITILTGVDIPLLLEIVKP